MTMPEATVNKTDGSEARENDVRLSWERFAVQAIPEPERMQSAA
jgi:hypothetical protein